MGRAYREPAEGVDERGAVERVVQRERAALLGVRARDKVLDDAVLLDAPPDLLERFRR